MHTIVASWVVVFIISRLLKHCGPEGEGGDKPTDGILKQSWLVGRSVGSVLGGFAQGFRRGLRSSMDDEKKG